MERAKLKAQKQRNAKINKELFEARVAVGKIKEKQDTLEYLMNEYYFERCFLIFNLTKLFPSWIEIDESIESAYFNKKVCLETPAGVVFFGVNEDKINKLFKGLETKKTGIDFTKISREESFLRLAQIEYKEVKKTEMKPDKFPPFARRKYQELIQEGMEEQKAESKLICDLEIPIDQITEFKEFLK